jgi:hypothetical protein
MSLTFSKRASLLRKTPENSASENFKGGCGVKITPSQARHSRQSTLFKKDAFAAAYLRAAQAYMLISMPTGTSTIFGAFQAILALLKVKPDELRPAVKVIRNENFASGIFPAGWGSCTNGATHNMFRRRPQVSCQNNDASIGSSDCLLRPMDQPAASAYAG